MLWSSGHLLDTNDPLRRFRFLLRFILLLEAPSSASLKTSWLRASYLGFAIRRQIRTPCICYTGPQRQHHADLKKCVMTVRPTPQPSTIPKPAISRCWISNQSNRRPCLSRTFLISSRSHPKDTDLKAIDPESVTVKILTANSTRSQLV